MSLGACTFGSSFAFGGAGPYVVTDIEGLDDLPSVRTADDPRSGRHGVLSGPDWSDGRIITVTLGLRGDTPAGLDALVAGARSALAPGLRDAGGSLDQALTFRDGDETCYGRVRRRSLPSDEAALWRIGTGVVEFYCPDPRVFGALQSGSAQQAILVGNLGFDVGFNLSFGGTGSSGGLSPTFDNSAGNVDGLCEFTLTAVTEIDSPSITTVATGGVFTIDGLIPAGSTLKVMPNERLVTLDGAPRRDLVATGSVWPTFPAGDTTEYQYRAVSYDAAATLAVTARSARL